MKSEGSEHGIICPKSNIIPEINAEVFQFYPALETLDLSSNQISEIKTSSFPRMQLKYL